MYPGELATKEANSLEAAALRMAIETSETLSLQRREKKRHRATFMQEVGVDELPVRLLSATAPKNGRFFGRAETYCVLRVEEREEVPEDDDDEASFGEATNSRTIAAKIIELCDGSDASSGGGSHHKDHQVTLAELKTALFRSEYNGFVTWLLKHENTVFAQFDTDHSKTLDYDELIYAIEL